MRAGFWVFVTFETTQKKTKKNIDGKNYFVSKSERRGW